MVPVKQNRESLSNALRAELELTAVPELVEQRLRQVYAELPDGKALRRRALPGWLRSTFVTASSLAAACLVLLGVNSVNPALAESLPLVGGIFQNINGPRVYGRNSQNFNENQQRIGEMALPAGENQVTIPANGLFEKPAKATLQEVYYDGSFVFAGVELEIDASEDRLTTLDRGGYDVLVNGEPQVCQDQEGSAHLLQYQESGFVDMSGLWWEQSGTGHYVTQRAFRVPEQFQGAESLDISLCFSAINGDKGNVNSTGFRLSFTAEKSPAALREIDCQGLEMGGVRLVRAYGTPAATYIEVEYPYELYRNPAISATFEDGLWIGSYGGTETGWYMEAPADGMARDTMVLAGIREDEERRVVWRLFDKNGSSQVEAVFLLDFQNGTAELGSPEDVKAAPEYNYACGVEAVKALRPGEYAVEKLHISQDKSMLYIMTGDSASRDLRIELYQEEKLAFRTYSGQDVNDPWRPDAYYWEYGDNGDWSEAPHAMYMLFLPDLYTQIDLTRPVTVKVFNKGSNELLCGQEITLTESRPEALPCHSPNPEELEGEAVESQAE